MKRFFAVLLAALLLLTGLTACASTTPTQSDSPEPTPSFQPALDTSAQLTLTVRGSWSNFEALEAVVNDWLQVYPNVDVEYSKVDGYNQQLASILTSNARPDLVMFDADGYYVDKDVVVDALLDLSDIGLELDLFDDRVINAASIDGKLCSLNWGLLANGFVVNMEILKELDIAVPTTHEEFLAACETLHQAGYTPIQGSIYTIYYNLMRNDWGYQLATTEDSSVLAALENAEEGCGAFFRSAFAQMLELMEKGYLDADLNASLEDIYEGSILYFFEGNTPFLVFNTESFSGMAKRETKSEPYTAHPFDYEFIPFPVSTETPVLSLSYIQGLSIVKDSPNEDWAKEFLRFVCQSEELHKMASVKGVPSTTNTGTADARFEYLEKVPSENRVAPGSSTLLTWINESMSDTLFAIANSKLTTVDEAQTYFEGVLRAYLFPTSAEE